MRIENPLVIVYQNEDGDLQTILNPGERNHQQYGILIADLVRHVANAFKVPENDVWEWVEKERFRPTSPVTELKPN
jgi:hypothetical protein